LCYDDDLSSIHPIKAVATTLYNIYTADILHANNTSLATFSDDTGIITASDLNIHLAINNLKDYLNIQQNYGE